MYADVLSYEMYDLLAQAHAAADTSCAHCYPIRHSRIDLVKTAASRAVQEAGYRVSLLEGSDLEKVASWRLPQGKWSNRISSITEDSQAFLKGEHGLHIPLVHVSQCTLLSS